MIKSCQNVHFLPFLDSNICNTGVWLEAIPIDHHSPPCLAPDQPNSFYVASTASAVPSEIFEVSTS